MIKFSKEYSRILCLNSNVQILTEITKCLGLAQYLLKCADSTSEDADYMAIVTTIQLCHCHVKVYVDEYGCILIKLWKGYILDSVSEA